MSTATPSPCLPGAHPDIQVAAPAPIGRKEEGLSIVRDRGLLLRRFGIDRRSQILRRRPRLRSSLPVAEEQYARAARLWSDCDPELRPLVGDLRGKLALLRRK